MHLNVEMQLQLINIIMLNLSKIKYDILSVVVSVNVNLLCVGFCLFV
mgnify:CR=1 FL=1